MILRIGTHRVVGRGDGCGRGASYVRGCGYGRGLGLAYGNGPWGDASTLGYDGFSYVVCSREQGKGQGQGQGAWFGGNYNNTPHVLGVG